MHDPAAERILVHLAPHYGEGEVGVLGEGSDGCPGRLDFDARIRECSCRAFVYLQPGLTAAKRDSVAVMPLGALGGCCRERQDDEHRYRERHQGLSTHG